MIPDSHRPETGVRSGAAAYGVVLATYAAGAKTSPPI